MKKFLFVAAFVALSTSASAAPWKVDAAQSQLTFEGKQGSTAFQGKFAKFDVKIDFDLAHPEKGSITATIDTASASAGSKERDEYLPQADWFNIEQFPQATFTSTSIAKVGECYEAAGNLTIKGVSKSLMLPFCLTKESDHYRAKGKVTLTRTDFNVGVGEWNSEAYVKFAVDVGVDLSVKP